MKIKKYIANTLQEGKIQILQELGDDAVILSSRNIKLPKEKGREAIEIIAAIDTAGKREKQKSPIPTKEEFLEKKVQSQPEVLITKNNDNEVIIDELANIKQILYKLTNGIKFKYSNLLTNSQRNLYELLKSNYYTDDFALRIVGNLASEDKLHNKHEALAYAKEYLLSRIKITEDRTEQRKIALFLGSTGSGKSTTLVKYAVIQKLVFGKDVLVISADSHKVGGIEQLQTYASLASIDFKAAYSNSELNEIINQYPKKEVILIDTTGRNLLEPDAIKEFKQLIKYSNANRIFAVESSNVSRNRLLKLFEFYSNFENISLILSKLDECDYLGEVFESLFDSKMSLSYVCTGQKIPEDFEPISEELINNYLIIDND
jgi:flagellar biosynthesis protein FlhF